MWFETKINNKAILIGSFYRSPSQSPTIRDNFFKSLDNILKRALDGNAHSVFLGGHFNLRNQKWWPEDVNSTEGKKLY
jgi:hypothetical protein